MSGKGGPVPCTHCGKDIPKNRLFRKKKPRSKLIIVSGDHNMLDEGYVAKCPSCYKSSTFNPDYIEEIYGKNFKGGQRSPFII